MRRRTGASISLAFLCVGCAIGGVQQTPFTGPAPSAVLVLPPVSLREGLAAEIRGLAAGAERALAGRGYRCMPIGAGYDLARRCGALDTEQPEPDALRRLRDQAGVDAVLRIEVSDWRIASDPRLTAATWDVTWRLLSAATGAQVWAQRLQGTWSRPYDSQDHLVRDPMEPQPAEIGGTLHDGFRSEQEIILALHQAACARLPENRQ